MATSWAYFDIQVYFLFLFYTPFFFLFFFFFFDLKFGIWVM